MSHDDRRGNSLGRVLRDAVVTLPHGLESPSGRLPRACAVRRGSRRRSRRPRGSGRASGPGRAASSAALLKERVVAVLVSRPTAHVQSRETRGCLPGPSSARSTLSPNSTRERTARVSRYHQRRTARSSPLHSTIPRDHRPSANSRGAADSPPSQPVAARVQPSASHQHESPPARASESTSGGCNTSGPIRLDRQRRSTEDSVLRCDLKHRWPVEGESPIMIPTAIAGSGDSRAPRRSSGRPPHKVGNGLAKSSIRSPGAALHSPTSALPEIRIDYQEAAAGRPIPTRQEPP
jgi:hypothetical protein